MDLAELLENGAQHFLPNLSIDLVIIGYRDNKLQCLLLKIGEKWLLPGGYIRQDTSVDAAALDILKSRTGLENTYLKFLAVFGGRDRQFSTVAQQLFRKLGVTWRADYWLNNRFVSLVYYSLVDIEATQPVLSHFDEAFAWFDFEALPDMWMDHQLIAQTAREQIKIDIPKANDAHHLLPEVFTMPQLHQLYQHIMAQEIDRSRFQKTMLATGLYERLPRLQKKSPGQNPYQYRVKKRT